MIMGIDQLTNVNPNRQFSSWSVLSINEDYIEQGPKKTIGPEKSSLAQMQLKQKLNFLLVTIVPRASEAASGQRSAKNFILKKTKVGEK